MAKAKPIIKGRKRDKHHANDGCVVCPSGVERKLSWVRSPMDARDSLFAPRLAAPRAAALPDKFVLPWLPPIYDQGVLSSCTANAAVAAYQITLVATGKTRSGAPLSRLFPYYFGRMQDNMQGQDAGAFIRSVVKALNKFGTCRESLWPYADSQVNVAPPANAKKAAKGYQVLAYHRVAVDRQAVQIALAGAGRAVIFGTLVDQAFVNNTSPEIAASGPKQVIGGHAMIIVGYDAPRDMYLIQNSWSERWGNKGRAWVSGKWLFDPRFSDDFWALDIVESGTLLDMVRG